MVTTLCDVRTVSACDSGTCGSTGLRGMPLIDVIDGMFAAASPSSNWLCGFDVAEPWSVLTTKTVAKPLPSGTSAVGRQRSRDLPTVSGTKGPNERAPDAEPTDNMMTEPG